MDLNIKKSLIKGPAHAISYNLRQPQELKASKKMHQNDPPRPAYLQPSTFCRRFQSPRFHNQPTPASVTVLPFCGNFPQICGNFDRLWELLWEEKICGIFVGISRNLWEFWPSVGILYFFRLKWIFNYIFRYQK